MMDKIIFICTGNTCRSPMCEGFFRKHNGQNRLGLEVQSAGLFTTAGMPASENAVQAAQERGADLTAHRSQPLTPALAAQAKYLVGMTAAHYDRLTEAFPQYENKIFTLAQHDINDPFGGDLETYRRAAADIESAVEALIEGMEKRA